MTKATCEPSLNMSSRRRISLSMLLKSVLLLRGPASFLSRSHASHADRLASLQFMWNDDESRKRLQHEQKCTLPFRPRRSCGTCRTIRQTPSVWHQVGIGVARAPRAPLNQGRSDGGVYRYIYQNQSTLQIFMWLLVVFSL